MFKNFKVFILCSILVLNNNIKAEPSYNDTVTAILSCTAGYFALAGFVELSDKSQSNVEKGVRGTYLGLTTAFFTALTCKEEMPIYNSKFAWGVLGTYVLGNIIYAAEQVLEAGVFEDEYRVCHSISCYSINQKYKDLLNSYEQLKRTYQQEDFSDDRSELLIVTCQEIDKTDVFELAQVCKKLNKFIKRLAVTNQANRNQFIESVRIYEILNNIGSNYHPYGYGNDDIKNCRKLLAIEQQYAKELVNPLDGVTIMTVLIAQNQIESNNQNPFDRYLQKLTQDCEELEKIQAELAKTNNYGLQMKISNLLVCLKFLELTVKMDLICKWWRINAIKKN